MALLHDARRRRTHVRAMTPEDLPAATAVGAAALRIDVSDRADRARYEARVAHPLHTDPDGCFVATVDQRIVGVAEVIRRDGSWILSLLAVDPAVQGTGAGQALMRRALELAPADTPGLIVSSNDSRALRLYAAAGFTLLPTFQALGAIDRRALPAPSAAVTEDAEPDFEALAALSRAVRGAEHTPELRFALDQGARLLTAGDRGFAVALPGRGVWLLVARDAGTGRALLWRALELAGDAEGRLVRWILGRQAWATEVVIEAGLRLSTYGALAVRGHVGPLHAYLPSGPFA